MKDIEGHGRTLIQYSHFELKDDLLQWLRENSRLPATSTAQYFQEIKELN